MGESKVSVSLKLLSIWFHVDPLSPCKLSIEQKVIFTVEKGSSDGSFKNRSLKVYLGSPKCLCIKIFRLESISGKLP